MTTRAKHVTTRVISLFKELQVLQQGGKSPFASPRELRGAKLRSDWPTLLHKTTMVLENVP